MLIYVFEMIILTYILIQKFNLTFGVISVYE